MKKSFVALLVLLALIVIISPGIVGRLAEMSMDENLDWAATEAEEVVVSSIPSSGAPIPVPLNRLQ